MYKADAEGKEALLNANLPDPGSAFDEEVENV
jgi:hypothetical protein